METKEIPTLIYEKAVEIIRLQTEIDRLEELEELATKEVTKDVNEAKDENGKSVYSNEALRSAEVFIRLNTRESYTGLKSNIRKVKEGIDSRKAEKERLENELKLRTMTVTETFWAAIKQLQDEIRTLKKVD